MMKSAEVVPFDVYSVTSYSACQAIMSVQFITDMRISLFLLLHIAVMWTVLCCVNVVSCRLRLVVRFVILCRFCSSSVPLNCKFLVWVSVW